MTQGKPSLLADLWAIKSMIKLYVEKKISGTTNHKSIRDECVDSFAETLGLKNDGPSRIRMEPYVHRHDWFYSCGAEPEPGEVVVPRHKNSRQTELERKLKDWHSISNNKAQNELREMMKETFFGAYKNGLIEKTDRWEFRFQKNGTKQ